MKTLLITGATDNIGRKLRAHLEATGKCPLRLLCLNPGIRPDRPYRRPEYLRSGLSGRVRRCTVLHVAADPSPRAGWSRIQSRDIDLLLNVLAAAHQHRVPRVVFASGSVAIGRR